jgi:hypothetical protein
VAITNRYGAKPVERIGTSALAPDGDPWRHHHNHARPQSGNHSTLDLLAREGQVMGYGRDEDSGAPTRWREKGPVPADERPDYDYTYGASRRDLRPLVKPDPANDDPGYGYPEAGEYKQRDPDSVLPPGWE